MLSRRTARTLLLFPSLFLLAACSDRLVPTEVDATADARVANAPGQLVAWFAGPGTEVMALPQTVYAAHDESTNQLVFGVEHRGVIRAVERIMTARGVPASAYRIELAQPIHFLTTSLRTEHRPTKGGIQIHFGGFLCTLGFNVDHSNGRSFITNSHCTDEQGVNSNTIYYQPTSSVSPNAIGQEAHDPAYSPNLSGCSSGKRCRYSDAARVAYNTTQSSRGVIAKTTGENNGSITTSGTFMVTDQNNTATSYSGTLHKVGRTTGWSSGNVSNTCATVNVSGSDIQLLCQTLVQRRGRQIVGAGDSGSPVFRIVSGDNVQLVGILWGGSFNGDLFVFSPLKNIRDELGNLTATHDGSPTEPPPGEDPEDPPPPECRPRGNSGNCI